MISLLITTSIVGIVSFIFGIGIGYGNLKPKRVVPSNISELQELATPYHFEIDEDYILEINQNLFEFLMEVQVNPLDFSLIGSKWKSSKLGIEINLGRLLNKDNLAPCIFRNGETVSLNSLERDILFNHFRVWESIYERYRQSLNHLTNKSKIKEKMVDNLDLSIRLKLKY